MKNILIVFVLTLFFLSCNAKKNLTLVKQWHLASHEVTLDIEKSKKIPQYQNQLEIFKYTESRIKENNDIIIYAEGCEGDIKKAFSKKFNGWNLLELKKYVDKSEYEHIMAPVPMKILAKYPKLTVLCGDSDLLIKENLKALSDVRGFTGFYQKLKGFKKTDLKKFELYKKQLLSLYPEAINQNILRFSLDKAKAALKSFEEILVARNKVFLENVMKNSERDFLIIIGGLHTFDLENRAVAANIESTTITPKAYSRNESLLIMGLKKILNSEVINDLSFFQVPEGFDPKKFPIRNRINDQLLFTDSEKAEMKKVISDKINFDLLLSDFDKDGVRDFTLSSSSTELILSSEDPDWDNDGIDNIIDDTVGDTVVAKSISKIVIHNNFFSKKNKQTVLAQTQELVKLANLQNVGHEQLVLEVFNQIAPMFKKRLPVLKYLVATKPTFSYGEKVFFSYVPQSNTIEYYPAKLKQYVNNEFQMRFKGVKFEQFVSRFVLPIIVHSLSHEFGHIDEMSLLGGLNSPDWDILKTKYEGKYLKKFRHKSKIIDEVVTKQSFRTESYKEWIQKYSLYTENVNSILRLPSKQKQLASIKKSQYRTDIKSDHIEHLLSFFKKHNIPSIYSLKNLSEWRAEMFAACVYKTVFPNSGKLVRSVELEHLIGFFPYAATKDVCKGIEQNL